MQFLFALLPLVAFYAAESAYGLRAGVAAAMICSMLDLGVGWWRTGKLSRMTLFTAALVLGLGSMSLLSNDERFVLWSPVVGDVVFATVLVGSLAAPRSILEVGLEEARPDVPLDPPMRQFLRGLTWRFALNLGAHAALTAWATTQSREVWLTVSGPVQYGMLFAQLGLEAWLVSRLPAPLEENDGGDGSHDA